MELARMAEEWGNGRRLPPNHIVADGSSQVRLTEREREVAELLSYGYAYKTVGRRLAITERAVAAHVSNAAAKIPGSGTPQVKVTVWFLMYGAEL